MKSLLSYIFLLVFSASVYAADNNTNLIEPVNSLVLLLSDGKAVVQSQSVQVKSATFINGPESRNDYVVLFSMDGWRSRNGSSQYLAIFEKNAIKDGPGETDKKDVSLVHFAKVGEDHWRVFESFSIFGEYIMLKGSNWDKEAGSSKAVTVVFRFDNKSLTEVNTP